MGDSSLWSADDQRTRLDELTASSTDPVKELPLRRDVRSLGTLLGRVLVEQAGEDLLHAVELLRRLLIHHREHSLEQSSPADFSNSRLSEAREIVSRLSISDAQRVTKAFAIYFELTNLAETNHRKRRRRAAKLHPEQPALEGSFRGTLKRMCAAGIEAEQALEILRKVKVVPVFTAHPTEVARRTVLLKRRRIAKQLERLDRLPLTESDAQQFESWIFAEVTALWQTDEIRLEKPLVTDEIRMGLDHSPMSLFAALPGVYKELADSLLEVYGSSLDDQDLPPLLAFGSWIGGDRDGNPFVTPASTREALERARKTILAHYIAELERVIEQLSASSRQVTVSERVRARLADYAAQMEAEDSPRARISSSEIYRRLLNLMATRLRHTRDELARARAYPSAAAFESDLLLIRQSLAENRGLRLARILID